MKALFKTGDLNKWAAHFTSIMEAFFRRNCACNDTAYPTGYSWVWPSLFGRRDDVFRTNRAGNSLHRRAGAHACETAQFAGTFQRLSGRRVCGTERGHFRRKQQSLLSGRLYHRCQYLRRVNSGREFLTLCRRLCLFQCSSAGALCLSTAFWTSSFRSN